MCRVSYTILTCRFTGMQLKVFVREPSEDVPQCRDTYPGKNGKRYEVIPIHSPAWGATLWQSGRSSLCLFQSTRPRGARQGTPVGCVLHMMFQSTRPRGARRLARVQPSQRTVSIHAPAWGATESCFSASCRVAFQSTRPRGARRRHDLTSGRPQTFQSTRPRGARRLAMLHPLRRAGSFNPRARVGRDRRTASRPPRP